MYLASRARLSKGFNGDLVFLLPNHWSGRSLAVLPQRDACRVDDAMLTTSPAPFIEGVCPVVETPFTCDGEVDVDGFERVLGHLLSGGVRTFMFPGFASEFHKLSDTERELLVRTMVHRVHEVSGAKVVVSVTDHATTLAVSGSRRAVEIGADLINLLPPYQFAPSPEAVHHHVRSVLDAVNPAPVVLQYAPLLTGTSLDAADLARIAAASPNLVQIKVESTPPGRLISALAEQTPSLPSAVGYAGVQLIDALRRGVVAVMPGCSFVELYLRIWDMWSRGDRDGAEELHRRLLPYISYWMQGVELIIQAEKRISMLRGLISSDHCRAPMRTLDSEELDMIDRFLSEFDELLPQPARSN